MYLQKMYEICSSISLVEEHLLLVGWRWNVVENLFTSNRTHFIFVFQNKNNPLCFFSGCTMSAARGVRGENG